MTANKWADTSTLRGSIERIIEPIISGGAKQDDIDRVVSLLEMLVHEHVEKELRACL